MERKANIITFDTLVAFEKLRGAGFGEKQAESVVRVLADAQSSLVMRGYGSMADILPANPDPRIDVLRAELSHTRWMIAAIAALFVLSIASSSWFWL